MAAIRFRSLLLLSKDVPSAAKFMSEGLGMSTVVITEKWAELELGNSTIAIKSIERYVDPVLFIFSSKHPY
jgi:hypothetical protein